ncbi:hypothetical protein N8590_02790 [bacterium]|nr:hypothetical protein [bacterium]
MIRTIKNKAIDYFVVFGKDYLKNIVPSFVEYYNTLRPLQRLENIPLSGSIPEQHSVRMNSNEIVCLEWLGGVFEQYKRRAA